MKHNNHKSWIIIVALVAVSVGYVALFFVPKCHEIQKLNDDLLTKRDFVKLSEQNMQLLKEIEKKLAATAAYNKTWTKHAPRQGEISITLGKINALARSANVAIDSFDPEPAETLDRVRLLPLKLQCSGRLTEVFGFVAQLEEMPQTIWIKKAVLEGNDKRSDREYRKYTQCELVMDIFMDNIDNSN